jgi:tetratricopeptide (TPR) repeat protein
VIVSRPSGTLLRRDRLAAAPARHQRHGTGQLAHAAEAFVGRTRELRTIEAACAAASAGRGSVVVVSGEAGIGKSRLCDEVAATARAAGLAVVAARCWVDGGAPPLWPWQPILRGLCGDEAADLLAGGAGPDVGESDRFDRFTAVADRLAAVATRSPACLLVDDVHAADAGALLLLRFVARARPRMPLVLVLTRRSGQPSPERFEARLVEDIEAEATLVALRPFGVAESAELLAAHGLGGVAPELLRALVRVSGGNPLHLRRIAALGTPHPDHAIPQGIQAAVQHSIDRLEPSTQDLLRRSAVLGSEPSVAEAASVAGMEPAAVLDALRDAAAAGLVTGVVNRRFGFGHEIVRAVLESGLTSSEHLDAHALAARIVAGDGPAISPDRLARRAHHALAAAPRSTDDARFAVSACQAAGRSMVGSLAYERADELLGAAVELHEHPDLGAPPGRLLVEWAQAAFLRGHMAEARTRFGLAATTAEHEHDAVTFAEAALGLGGHWLNEAREPVERARVLGLQRSALGRLPAGERSLRVRLEARLAAEDVYDGAAIPPVYAALDAARRGDDAAALAEVLSLCHHALLAPEHAAERTVLADELIRAAAAAGHGVLALMGLLWRTVDLFLLGDGRAGRALRELRKRADALACGSILYIVDVIDVMELARAGRLDEAEAAAQRCYELGLEVGEADALGYLGAMTLAIHWVRGSEAEVLDIAERVAASTTLVQAEFAFRATAVVITAHAGEPDRARTALDRLVADGLASLPRSSTWLAGMAAIVEAAAALGDPALAREAYALLAPFADRPIMPSLAVVCLGSTERSLGTAALTFDDVDRAIAHLERAVEHNLELGNRPLVAVARAELARALQRRGSAGDIERSGALLEETIDEAERMGMWPRAAAWRAAREERRDVGVAAVAPRSGTFRREGRGWLVTLGDHRAYVAGLVGMEHLARLLAHPGQQITALQLAAAGPVAPEAHDHELLDGRARAAYAARATELAEDLSEAEGHADIGRAERLRAELDMIVDQLEAASGLHGPRHFTNNAERARTAVRKAIKRAIDKIDRVDATIGRHLHSSVTTGSVCSYAPDPRGAVVWATDDR